jgi:hypothetical protein
VTVHLDDRVVDVDQHPAFDSRQQRGALGSPVKNLEATASS